MNAKTIAPAEARANNHENAIAGKCAVATAKQLETWAREHEETTRNFDATPLNEWREANLWLSKIHREAVARLPMTDRRTTHLAAQVTNMTAGIVMRRETGDHGVAGRMDRTIDLVKSELARSISDSAHLRRALGR